MLYSRHRCRSRNCNNCSVAAYDDAIRQQQHAVLLNSSFPNLSSSASPRSPVVSTPRSPSPLATAVCLHCTRESETTYFEEAAETRQQVNGTHRHYNTNKKRNIGECSSLNDESTRRRKDEASREYLCCVKNAAAMTAPIIPYWNKAKAILSPEDVDGRRQDVFLLQSDGHRSAGNAVQRTPSSSTSTFVTQGKPTGDGKNVKQKRWTLEQLRATDGIIPCQMGTNQFSSQRGMTGFGAFRNTTTPVQCSGYKMEQPLYIREKCSDAIIPLQYGTNQFASQRGMTGFGAFRDVTGNHVHTMVEDTYPARNHGLRDSYQGVPPVFHGQG